MAAIPRIRLVRPAEDAPLTYEDIDDSGGLLHFFLTPNPKPGDRAACGFIKVTPLTYEDIDPSRWQFCVVCAEFYNGEGE